MSSLHMLHYIFSPLSLWWVHVFAQSAFMKSLAGNVNVLTKTPDKFFILVLIPVLRFGSGIGLGCELRCELGFGLDFGLGFGLDFGLDFGLGFGLGFGPGFGN